VRASSEGALRAVGTNHQGVVIHIDTSQLDITNLYEKFYIDICSRAKESEEVCVCHGDKTVIVIQ